MYSFFLGLHNINRYVIVIIALILLFRSIMGWRNKAAWDDQIQKFGLYYTSALDTQFLLGLLLYFFFSPLTKVALSDFGAAMSESAIRFFALEHPLTMLLSVVMGHVAYSSAKNKEMEATKRHQRIALFVGLSLLFIILGHLGGDMAARLIPFF
jgi:hypothetical protein